MTTRTAIVHYGLDLPSFVKVTWSDEHPSARQAIINYDHRHDAWNVLDVIERQIIDDDPANPWPEGWIVNPCRVPPGTEMTIALAVAVYCAVTGRRVRNIDQDTNNTVPAEEWDGTIEAIEQWLEDEEALC